VRGKYNPKKKPTGLTLSGGREKMVSTKKGGRGFSSWIVRAGAFTEGKAYEEIASRTEKNLTLAKTAKGSLR